MYSDAALLTIAAATAGGLLGQLVGHRWRIPMDVREWEYALEHAAAEMALDAVRPERARDQIRAAGP